MTRKNWWIFPSIFILTLIIFHQSLSYYFFQDDWFVLNWVRTENLLSFFSFRTDIIYWRPLSMPIFFAISKYLFGLNPVGFHILAFIFHFINIILVYLMSRQLNLKKKTAIFIAFIWGTAAFHFVALSWLSTTSYVLGSTFIFSTIISFLKSKMKTSFIFFILALGSSEMAIITIPLLIIMSTNIRKDIKNLFPFLIPTIPYLVARLIVFPVPTTGNYAISFSKKVLVNFAWYFAWMFNFAERFSTIFYFSTIKSSFNQLIGFAKLLIGPVVLMLSFMFIVIVSKPAIKTLTRGVLWFIVGLSPVIFLPNHVYAMYLPIASIGIFYIIGIALEKIKRYNSAFMIILTIIWYVSSFTTINFERSNSWLSNEQAVSRAYVNLAQNTTKNPQSGSIFLFKEPSINFANQHGIVIVSSENTISQSLNGSDAIQVLYNDSSLKSLYFQEGQQLNAPKGLTVYDIDPRTSK